MVQQAKENAPKYEMMVILLPDLSQEDIDKQLNKIRKEIKDLKGEIYHEDLWDIKDLAYIIKKQDKGYYAVFYFSFEPDKIAELKNELMLDSKILRHLIIKSPREYKIKKLSEMEKEEKKKEPEKAEKTEKSEKSEKSVKTEKSETPETEKKPKEEPKKEKKEEKKTMDISDLDSQLESILEDPDIDIKL
jgi:ribosomal protein S6